MRYSQFAIVIVACISGSILVSAFPIRTPSLHTDINQDFHSGNDNGSNNSGNFGLIPRPDDASNDHGVAISRYDLNTGAHLMRHQLTSSDESLSSSRGSSPDFINNAVNSNKWADTYSQKSADSQTNLIGSPSQTNSKSVRFKKSFRELRNKTSRFLSPRKRGSADPHDEANATSSFSPPSASAGMSSQPDKEHANSEPTNNNVWGSRLRRFRAKVLSANVQTSKSS